MLRLKSFRQIEIVQLEMSLKVRIINLQFVSEDEESVGDVKGVDSCLCSVQSTADQKVLIRTRVGKSSI